MTIFNEKDKYIYVHIPKTGGQTIKNSLNEDDINCIECKDLIQYVYDSKCYDKKDRIRNPYHFTWKEIEQYFNISNPKKYFIFTFVRNPYDRFYSLYEHAKKEINKNTNLILLFQLLAFVFLLTSFFLRRNKSRKYLYILASMMCINFYLIFKFNYIKLYIDVNTLPFNEFFRENFDSVYQIYYNYFKPQYLYTEGIEPDFIGREENFENDVKTFLKKVGKDVEIKNINIKTLRSNTKDEFKYLNKFDIHTINLVNRTYKRDFSKFNYKQISIRDFLKINGKREMLLSKH